MKVVRDKLPKKYHDAVVKWRKTYFPDYDILMKYWDKFFPSQEQFCLCAKHDLDTPDVQVVGPHKGESKTSDCKKLSEEQAHRLLAIIKAQASTEFGSIQQHQGTLDKATEDEERFFVMRVMAEELRHGYQMFDLLTNDAWGEIANQDPDEFIEEVLDMRTGSHVLGAFNIEYDSFFDSIVFAAVIDRVGKYQLTMQKVCAYKPMGSSMTPMLEEEAFHLVAGVFPLRRWVRKIAAGDTLMTMDMIQRYLNKWIPRAYEMFGHEKGGQTNIEMGFKDMVNQEALDNYRAEVQRMVADLNKNYVRARLPKLSGPDATSLVDHLLKHHEEKHDISWEDLLYIPEYKFFRRRGQSAMEMWDVDGQKQLPSLDAWIDYLRTKLPEPYLIHRDFDVYASQMRQIDAGELTAKDAEKMAPKLFRTSYCPCSKSVRWIEETPNGNGNGGNGSGEDAS